MGKEFRIQPRGDRAIIEKTASDKMGRIILPNAAKKTSLRGTVVAVGETVLDYKPGDDVLFGTFSPVTLDVSQHDDLREYENLFILNCGDIIALIRNS